MSESPSFEVRRPLSTIAGKRLTFTYEPSSSADWQVLVAALASGQTSFAAYLVRMTPKLKLEDAEIGVGLTGAVAQDHYLQVAFSSPWEVLPREYRVTSGDVSAIVINSSGVTANEFNARTQKHDLRQNPETPNYVPEMLHQIGVGWWGEKYAFEDVMGTQMGVLKYNLPSHARVGAILQARYFFGVARSASFRGRVMDAKLDYMAVESLSDSSANKLNFMRAVGQLGSFLEGAIFDQAFASEIPRGISSVSLLAAANMQGVPVYTLSQGNSQEIANLTVHPDVKQEITDAIAAGGQVTISRDEVNHHGYTGVGYIIEDIEGAAAYQIDGGLSGGGADGAQSVLPLPALTFTPIIGILLAPTLRQLGAKLLIDSAGQLVGVGFFQSAIPAPGPIPSPDLRVAALIATLLAVLSAMKTALDNTYPRQPVSVAKYSSATQAEANFSQKMIRASSRGTFGGNVVYLALQEDPVVRGVLGGRVPCPPGGASEQLAELYQIPQAGGPYDPTEAEAYVSFELTRPGLYNETTRLNGNGVVEILVPETHLLPKFAFPDDNLGRLYIGEWAPGIENVQLCR